MTPEDTDKIIAAIDRNIEKLEGITAAIDRLLFWIFVISALMVLLPKAKASPLLAAAPEPPALQYWHTVDIPQAGGVYPLEVYAPVLPALFAQSQIVEIGEPPAPPTDVPEPGTWLIILIPLLVFVLPWALATWEQRQETKQLEDQE